MADEQLDTDLGVVNWFLDSAGLGRIGWLGERWAARIAIAIVDSWQSIPFVMLMTLAALSALPEGPHEAACVDGATPWRTFRFVTFPMLLPVLYVTLLPLAEIPQLCSAKVPTLGGSDLRWLLLS